MKIRLAMLDNDSNYLKRVIPVFNNKFASELEIYSFTDVDSAMHCLDDKKIDVFLASDNFKIDFTKVPKKCGFAYLVENLDVDSINNYKTVCKFQKGDLIYKQILSIYSDHAPNITGIANVENGAMKTILFTSPCGGVGNSTVAAGCAINISQLGYRVLYLNTEIYGDADEFFSCDGQFDFSDVIYAIKSNKTNRAMKLQSTIKSDDSTGVSFYSSVKVPLDIMEMNTNDYVMLQNELKQIGCYDYVIIDMDFPTSIEQFSFLYHCNSVVVVTDSTEISEKKLAKAVRAVEILDGQSEYSIQPRMWLVRNKSSENAIAQNEIKVLGTFPMYQSVMPTQMARQLALADFFNQLI